LGRKIKKNKEDSTMLSSLFKLVPILASANITAGVDCDSFSLLGVRRVMIIVMFSTDLSGNPVLTLYSGATNGAHTTALTFNYRYGGAAIASASADVLTAFATSAALTCTGTTFVSRMLTIEIWADQVTDGHKFLTLQVGACTAGIMTALALMEVTYTDPGADTFI
jgi:hypothetical protein